MYPGFLVPGVVTIPIGAFSSPAAMAARMRHRMRHPCRSDWRRLCVDGFRRRRSDREFDFADLVLTAYSHPPLAERTPMSPHCIQRTIVCGFWGFLRTFSERKNYARFRQHFSAVIER